MNAITAITAIKATVENGPMSDTLIAHATMHLHGVLKPDASVKVRERQARKAIETAGGDASDPLLVALVLERAGEAGAAIAPPEDGGSWLYRIKTGTGWPDRFVAELIDQSRATVQAYIGGRIPETITRAQARALVEALKQQREAINGLIADLAAQL
jgi:hypothetical protein